MQRRLHLTVSRRADGVSEGSTRRELGAVRTVGGRPLSDVAARSLQRAPWAAP